MIMLSINFPMYMGFFKLLEMKVHEAGVVQVKYLGILSSTPMKACLLVAILVYQTT